MKEDEFPLSRLIFFICLSFIFGLILSPFVGSFYFLILLFLLLFLLFSFLDTFDLFIVLIFFSLGIFYRGIFPQEFVTPIFEGEEITIKGRVVEEDRNVVKINKLNNLKVDEKVILHIEGDLKYGQVVRVTGRPVSPSPDFKNYLHKDGIGSSIFNPEVVVLEEGRGIRHPLFSIRRILQEKIERGLPFPESSVLKAVLLGDRTEIPSELQEKFQKSGTAHLLAISGTHIVIIAGVIWVLSFILKIKHKFLFSSVILLFFILLTGAPPSAIRAGFMGSLFILATCMGRKTASIRSLVYIAFFMTLVNPLILYDVGFQLSFGAAAGIIFISPKMESFLIKKPFNPEESFFKKVQTKISKIFSKHPLFSKTLIITVSAQIFVFPLIYLYFDYLPIIAPLSNIFLAPLLPLIMILGIFSLLLSFLIPESIAFLITFLILRVVLILVELFYNLSLL